MIFFSCFWVALYSTPFEYQVKTVFVLNAKIKLSFSRLRHQLYVMSGLALGSNFENYEVACCWPIFPQYRDNGMLLLSMRAVYARNFLILLKPMNVYITSKFVYCDSKIHLHHVKQVDWHVIRQTLGMLTNILRKNKKYPLVLSKSQRMHFSISTLAKRSNRSPGNFNILGKISNNQKIPIFQRKV